ncbi:DUF3943 domain-containing protein [Thiobacillus sp.]
MRSLIVRLTFRQALCHLAHAGRYVALGIACSAVCVLPAVADSTDPGAFTEAPWAMPALRHHSTTQDDGTMQPDGYRWRGPAPTQPDWPGAGRDTAYFLGYQFAAITVLYVAPESISGWDSEQKSNYSFDKWRHNVSEPVWDEDRWWINYILHPYWGGAYYIRARERGLDRAQAFLYSALLSTLFEYGAEALAEPVSIQDLIVTPVVGALVGEYLFSPLRERIRAKPGKLVWSDKAILFITDPLGVINAETDRLLGVKTTLQFQRISMRIPATGMDNNAAAGPLEYARKPVPAWGVQLRVDW